MADRTGSAPKNIALSGHYGSGKSSVILGVQDGLDERDIKWVNLSLSSLGTDNTKRERLRDGATAPLTNLIQKEIVKQLLYRKAPKDMPGSRYFRIDAFRAGRATQWAVSTGVGVFALAVLAGLVARVEQVAPRWLANGPSWGPWAIVGLIGVFAGLVHYLLLRGLQNPIKVDSVSAGGAAVTLSAKENSYFDEYLDEIVYFFQQTQTRVAIFEDLDRFKDPHIFETLRELNTVLNNSEQVKSRPVKFVYAVRDSIFEQLDIAMDSATDEVVADPEATDMAFSDPLALPAAAQESIPSANRTKFFDLVVPMVPFLTHRSARDLLTEEFKDSVQKPSPEVINLIGSHPALTDMRLIRNIRNEFEIYRSSVLSETGLQGLTADRLFAMMVYKNTHLEDFEAIRHGTSSIDRAHRAFRGFVEYQSSALATQNRAAMSQIRSLVPWDRRARAVGQALHETLPILHRANRNRTGAAAQVITSFGTYELGDLGTGDFWKRLHETRESIAVGNPGYNPFNVSFEEFLALGGDAGKAMQDTVERDETELRRQAGVALDTRSFVATATMADLLARTDLTMPIGAGEVRRTLDQIVADLVSPLARDLLAQGLLDENFTLYCSDYQGVAISVSAMNFILHSVQANQADPLYRFDDPASIDAVEQEKGERFLAGEAVFNIEVFDHYLTRDPERLDDAIDRLVVRSSSGSAPFIDMYLEDDKVQTKDAFVAALAPRWPNVLAYLARESGPEQQVQLIDAAMRAAAPTMKYEASESLISLVENHYQDMSVFTDQVTPDVAANLADLLDDLEVEISDLSVLGPHQLRAFVAAGLYVITRRNLESALARPTDEGDEKSTESGAARLALDAVKTANANVYARVTQDLGAYLEVLSDDEATIEDPEEFLGVLNDIAGAPVQLIQDIAVSAYAECLVSDLAGLSEAVWLPVVAADRFATSVSNVSRYVQMHGVTPEMAESLRKHDLTAAETLSKDDRAALAYWIVEIALLTPDRRIQLLSQLGNDEYLEASELGEAGLAILPQLLAAGEVRDSAGTYGAIADGPWDLRERYFASSPALASYVTALPLSSGDLEQIIKSRTVSADVKRTIAAAPDFVSARITQRVAISMCDWALKGYDISTTLLLVLSQADAPAEKVLPLLVPHLHDIELSELDAILSALGDDYEPLTRRGHHRPRLKPRIGTEPLLEELKLRDRVSSYRESKLGGIRVYMRT